MSAYTPKIVIHFDRMDETPREISGRQFFSRPLFSGNFDKLWEAPEFRDQIQAEKRKAH